MSDSSLPMAGSKRGTETIRPDAKRAELVDEEGEAHKGMVVLTQPRRTDGTDRLKLKKGTVLAAIAALSLEMVEEGYANFPEKPTDGFDSKDGELGYGPWYIYWNMEHCAAFVEINDAVQVEGVDATGANPITRQINLTARAVNLSKPLKEGQLSANALATETVHVIVHVAHGRFFSAFQNQAIKIMREAFGNHGFQVYKASQQGTKIDGQVLKGPGTKSNTFHFNIRPTDGNIFGAHYPAVLSIPFMGTTQYIEYVICDHPDLMNKICQKGCHRYTMHSAMTFPAMFTGTQMAFCQGVCTAVRGSSRNLRGETKSAEELLKAKAEQQKADNALTPCEHFETGLCLFVHKGKR